MKKGKRSTISMLLTIFFILTSIMMLVLAYMVAKWGGECCQRYIDNLLNISVIFIFVGFQVFLFGFAGPFIGKIAVKYVLTVEQVGYLRGMAITRYIFDLSE